MLQFPLPIAAFVTHAVRGSQCWNCRFHAPRLPVGLPFPVKARRSRHPALVWLMCLVILIALDARAQSESGILEQCRQLSLQDSDIHNCLDNYLDDLDQNLATVLQMVSVQLAPEGGGEQALPALQRSQSAFENFRRENCLWYLEFSSPRNEAEQIAKNCLAGLSEWRLQELRGLLDPASRQPVQRGFYVLGANLNTFTPCGSTAKLWVEGDANAVVELQQRYITNVSDTTGTESELTSVYVELNGEVDTTLTEVYENHDGVFRLRAIQLFASEAQATCDGAPVVNAETRATAPQNPSVPDSERLTTSQTELESTADQAEQALAAYFGDWTALCRQLGSSYGCTLATPLKVTEGANDSDMAGSLLQITRRSEQRTIVDVEFPPFVAGLIADVDQISWRVDSLELGNLLSSQLGQGQGRDEHQGKPLLLQSLRERWFIRDELLPLLIKGKTAYFTLQPEGAAAVEFSVPLTGLTRALNFADDFTAAEGEI